MKSFLNEIRVALAVTVALAVVVCAAYPVAVFALGQGLFPRQANGSFVMVDGFSVGSTLLGQQFEGPRYFHPRPSAAGNGYDPMASGGANLGPLSKKLAEAVKQRAESYRHENSLPPDALVPADAVTASASGLDPHISLENASLQVARVASARGLPIGAVEQAIQKSSRGRTLWVLGQPRVNVLALNLALDAAEGQGSSPQLGGRLSSAAAAAGRAQPLCPLFVSRPDASPFFIQQPLCACRHLVGLSASPCFHLALARSYSGYPCCHPERSEGSQPPRATKPVAIDGAPRILVSLLRSDSSELPAGGGSVYSHDGKPDR